MQYKLYLLSTRDGFDRAVNQHNFSTRLYTGRHGQEKISKLSTLGDHDIVYIEFKSMVLKGMDMKTKRIYGIYSSTLRLDDLKGNLKESIESGGLVLILEKGKMNQAYIDEHRKHLEQILNKIN